LEKITKFSKNWKNKKNSDGFEDVLGMHNAHLIYIKKILTFIF
jgi:hypothetical protein